MENNNTVVPEPVATPAQPKQTSYRLINGIYGIAAIVVGVGMLSVLAAAWYAVSQPKTPTPTGTPSVTATPTASALPTSIPATPSITPTPVKVGNLTLTRNTGTAGRVAFIDGHSVDTEQVDQGQIGDIYLYDPENGTTTQLTHTDSYTYVYAWSPDNKYILASRLDAQKNDETVIVDTTTGEAQVVSSALDFTTNVGYGGTDTAWVSNTLLHATSTDEKTNEVSVYEVTTSGVATKLYTTKKLSDICGEGAQLVMSSGDFFCSYAGVDSPGPFDISVFKVGGSAFKRIASGDYNILGAIQSKLLYEKWGSKTDEVGYMNTDGSKSVKLFTTSNATTIYGLTVSKDTTYLSYALFDDKTSTYAPYLYDLIANKTKRLPNLTLKITQTLTEDMSSVLLSRNNKFAVVLSNQNAFDFYDITTSSVKKICQQDCETAAWEN